MYIIKNALRCISRSIGRNVLIGIIVFVIAVSSCIGLSIRQAAQNAKEETMDTLSVTATISYDRQSLMEEFGGAKRGGNEMGEPPAQPPGGFDRDSFKDMMGQMESLTLSEYQTYASASSVKDFYYTSTVYLNGSDDVEAVSSSSADDTDSSSQTQQGFGGMNPMGAPGGMGGMMSMNMGDFTVTGYSSDIAMTDFVTGVATISEGEVFSEGTQEYQCVISNELATYNELNVDDKITLTNPNNEDETYTLTVVGIYEKSSSEGDMSSRFNMTMSDPANEIYMSSNAVDAIIAKSETENSDDDSLTLRGSLDATYTFADVESYEQFTQEVYDLGLDENYTVTSSDITAYEQSLVPLETLSTTAGYFLIVILCIGAVILVVLNIFNVRERKYEIGVLTAMGMQKFKVAMQFMTEIFIVTLCAVILGVAVGGVSAVPVANAMLESKNAAQVQQSEQMNQFFGRENNMQGGFVPDAPMMQGSAPGGFMENMPMMNKAADYVTEINSAMNLTVVFQMLLIAIGLILVSGMVSMLFVMRYEPLKILSNRD